jgi:hypothetical protein
LALPNLIPAFAEDDNIGLFFSSCREGESVPLVVSMVLVRGGNMRERTTSARAYFSPAAERGGACHL